MRSTVSVQEQYQYEINWLRRRVDKHDEQDAGLRMVFFYLEEAFGRVSHKLLWRTLRRKGCCQDEVWISQDMHKAARTYVRTACGHPEFETDCIMGEP